MVLPYGPNFGFYEHVISYSTWSIFDSNFINDQLTNNELTWLNVFYLVKFLYVINNTRALLSNCIEANIFTLYCHLSAHINPVSS